MANFTDEEIQTAVEKLVQSSISTGYGSLGNRRLDVTWAQIQQSVAGVFILYPTAPYYCIHLGCSRTIDLLTEEASTISQLLEAVNSLGRNVLPLEDVSPLFNAVAALQALQSAVSTTAPMDITKLAQYQRFDSNVSSFLSGPGGSSIKQNSVVVPTPQEARSSIPGLMSKLKEQHSNLVSVVTNLAGSIDDFITVNLPSIVASGVIANAASVLGTHASDLNDLPVDERLSSIRGVVLDVLAAKSAVKKMGSFPGQSPLYSINGNGFAYSDATHPATPASILGDLAPSYNVVPGVNDTLQVTVEGSTTVNLILPSSSFATLSGTIVEGNPSYGTSGVPGYLIGDGASPVIPGGLDTPNNNHLRFSVFNRTTQITTIVDCTLTVSVASGGGTIITLRTADQIAADINTALASHSLTTIVAEAYFYPTFNFSGLMDIAPISGPSASFTLSGGVGSLAAVSVGDLVSVPAGPNAGLFSVTSVSGSVLHADKLTGTPTSETGRNLSVGSKYRAVRIKCTDITDLQNEIQLTVLGDTTVAVSTAATFGLVPSAFSTSSGLFPSDVVNAINTQTTKVTATSEVTNAGACSLNTDPSSPTHVVLSKILTSGNVTFTPGSPNRIDVTFPSGGLAAAGVVTTDILVLRGQNNTSWFVTAVTDTTVTATSFIATATNATGAAVEIGIQFNVVEWMTLHVLSGPNVGTYIIDSVGVSPLDLNLKGRTSIPHYVDPTTSLAVRMADCEIGIEYLQLASANTTTASSIVVAGTARPLFFSAPTTTQVGTSPYFFIPQPDAGGVPLAGDILKFFATDYNNPSATFVVQATSLVGAGVVLTIDPEVSTSPLNWQFTPQPPPFAQLSHGHVVDFTSLQKNLYLWLALPVNQPQYFQTLNRLINPLLANQSPTAVEVADAVNGLVALAQHLTIAEAQATDPNITPLEQMFDNYTVDPVPAIDALIRTYTSKGSDRAIDILLQGEFSTFFGLDADQASYAGNVQSTMRAVAQNDLAINSTSRTDAIQSRSIGSAQSPDYEFSSEDVETGLKPDAPADYAKDLPTL